ncbi:UNVERIFIED_CONTAM: Retrovirus-related Pol polyprotein from transposon TNT 1-94 [Sesamum radiatum]|uniref:Retrovirus-related Pol polyprotein from transposon TNT 1-94 n=1 Tax=Sesamum radiatum TaxID=300843 RepID=A0AAW2WGW1_SESRA
MAESTSTAAIASDDCQYERDVLYLHPSEHSGLSLSSIPLNGSNFLVWSRSIYVSLGTRMKLGFIDRSFPQPATGSKTFEQWRRVDLMVISWIWNSISKDIVEAFMYASSSRELWLELQRRYGRKLMQFLMGLHEVYESERSQILMMDPLPDVEKAYAMVLSVEKQRSVHINMKDFQHTNSIYHVAGKENKRGFNAVHKKKLFIDKRSLVCDHCHKSGHSKDSCFKLHGIPDWYKNLPEQKKKESGVKGFAASVTDVACKEGSSHQSSDVRNQNNVSVMMAEILKLVKENAQPSNPLTVNYANYVYDDVEFAVCPLAKQARIPFPLSESHSSIPFELLHMDLWGPYKEHTISDCNYIFTIVDDCSRSLWTFLLKHKSQEPKSYKEAVKHPEWQEAMRQRSRLSNRIALGRLLHCLEFLSVAKAVTVRIFLAIAAGYAWPIQQLDINNAFLHGYLDEDLYMDPPEGYNVEPSFVCKLERSLYGLKQASRQWNLEFTHKLEQYGFAQSANDHCLFHAY